MQRAPNSWLLFRALKLAEKLFEEIGGNVPAVCGGGANVVDGKDLGQQCCACSGYGKSIDRLAADGVLGAKEARGECGEAGGSDVHFADDGISYKRCCAERDLCDGHGAASTHLAQILPMVDEMPWDVDGVQKLIGNEYVFLVAGVEVTIPDASRASGGDQLNLGVVNEKCGRRVGGGRAVDEIAADGCAALVGDGADPRGGAGQQRKVGGDGGVIANIGERGAGANDDGVGPAVDEA